MPSKYDMSLVGAAALIDALNDMGDAYTPSGNGFVIYTDVQHGLYQEYGTIYHPPQPHFRPALSAGGGRMGTLADTSPSVDDLMNRTADEILKEIRARAPVRTGELRSSYTKEAL